MPESVDHLLAKEFKEGFMIGPFAHPPFPNLSAPSISQTGNTLKRNALSLIFRHPTAVPSQALIDFSLHYVTIHHDIALIKLVGKGLWLSKADITSDILPIHYAGDSHALAGEVHFT